MESHVQKWGNSLGIRIPAALARDLHLEAGKAVNIRIENEQLVITAIQLTLAEMLDQITAKNCHHNHWEEDAPKGNEAW